MNELIVIITILGISGIGYMMLTGFRLFAKQDTLLALGCSYGLGVGLIAAQLFVYSWLQIPWGKALLITPWLFIAGILLVQKKVPFPFRFTMSRKDIISWGLFGGIVLSTSYVLFEALLRPVTTWDAWANWLFQSKVFFVEGSIRPESLMYMDSEYPLTINLLGTFIYVMLGVVDDTAVLLFSSAFFIFLAMTFFAVLNKKYGLRYALLFTFLLVTIQNFVRHGGRIEAGLADLPLGYMAFVSVILLFEYFKRPKVKILILLTIFLSITSLIKFEGIPLACFIGACALVHLIRHKLYNHICVLILGVVPFVLWQADRWYMGINNTYFTSGGHFLELSMAKTLNAFAGTFSELIRIPTWNVLWILYFFAVFAFGLRKDKALFVLNAIILSQFTVYLMIYNLTAGNNPESSIERLLMHIAPLALLYLAILGKTNKSI